MNIYSSYPAEIRIDTEVADIFYVPEGLTFWHSIMSSENIDTLGIMKEYVQEMDNLYNSLDRLDKHVYDIGFQIDYLEEEDGKVIQIFRLYGATENGIRLLVKETYTQDIKKAIKEYLDLHEWLVETNYYSDLTY